MSMNCVVISLLAFAMLLFVLVGVRYILNDKEGFLEYIVYGRPGWGWRRWGGDGLSEMCYTVRAVICASAGGRTGVVGWCVGGAWAWWARACAWAWEWGIVTMG
jgi:hypothetical protein